jgi:hypothetical protein
MHKQIILLGTLRMLVASSLCFAQVKNEGLSNQILAARQKNAAMLKQYNWNCMTQFIDNGQTKDTRIELVSIGPDGKPQRTVINDQHAPMPGGFLRKRIAEDEKKKLEKYLKGLHEVLDQYTLSSAGAVINFISTANITAANGPDGNPVLTCSGNNVVSPGDSLSMGFNPNSFAQTTLQVGTTFDGDAVTLTATFRTMPNGPTHLQYATVSVPDKNIVLQIHNYDYVLNN